MTRRNHFTVTSILSLQLHPLLINAFCFVNCFDYLLEKPVKVSKILIIHLVSLPSRPFRVFTQFIITSNMNSKIHNHKHVAALWLPITLCRSPFQYKEEEESFPPLFNPYEYEADQHQDETTQNQLP